MKILHVTFSLANAGKENMLVDIANEQQSMGHDVAILVINDSLEPSIVNRIGKNISLFRLNRKNQSRNPIHFFKLFYVFNFRFKADVIHSHDPQLGLLLKLTSFIPAVLTVHGPDFDTSAMKYYNKRFAVSKSVKKDVESRSDNLCEIIYNGIKIKGIKQREANFNRDTFQLVMVGRLDHQVKGQDLLIEAAHLLVIKKGLTNIKFSLVGEGPSRPFLQELISSLNLGKNVFLLGNKDREWIYENLRTYDLFVQPSRLEGFGLTVVEAMAAKVPVIASNIEGPAEILENGKQGIMFENNNAEDLSTQIEYAIRLYENGEILKMIGSAYNHCMNNFDITRTAHQYCLSY
ncbi:MAG: glycosyltransferase [Bacteroidota bacterium]